MEFISAEEFKKQSNEVQRELKLYWLEKVSEGDLFEHKNSHCIECVDFVEDGNVFSITDEEYDSLRDIPLLVEGQLRQFIEDRGYFITLNATSNTYDLFNIKTGRHCRAFEHREKTILETYFKVAIEIAKEEIYK